MPPVPKPASIRRGHRNHSARSVLHPVDNPVVPDLPDYCDWHPAVREFWRDAWESPMPQEWTYSDRHNVLLAVRAMQVAWSEDSGATARMTAMAEARLLFRECGLTPMSRRSLQIEIARAEDATERREEKRSRPTPIAAADPREAFGA